MSAFFRHWRFAGYTIRRFSIMISGKNRLRKAMEQWIRKGLGHFIIASLRKEKCMTQEAFGERLGGYEQDGFPLEKRQLYAGYRTLRPLAETLGTSVNELLSGERLTEAALLGEGGGEFCGGLAEERVFRVGKWIEK